MTDTTKTEVDMGYVQGFVNLIAQALVAATELPKQIEAMQNDLTILHGDLDRTKQRNIELDTLTGDLRRQRDEAEQALSHVRNELVESNRDRETVHRENMDQANRISLLNDKVTALTKERDDYGLQAMSAEDRAKAAEAKLDKLREAMGLPKAEPEKPMTTTTTYGMALPEPTPEPPKPAGLKRIYQGEPGYDMAHDKWDDEKQKYYSEEILF